MVKKLRYQENRKNSRRNGSEPPRLRWVFEPIDAVLLAVIISGVFWLQWRVTELARWPRLYPNRIKSSPAVANQRSIM